MNEDTEKAAPVKFPPPVIGILTIIVGHVLGRFLPLFPDIALPTPARYWIGGIVCVLSIAIFVILPARQFNATGQDPKPWTPTPEIVVSGLYRYTRNPMYVGMLIFCLGFAVILSEAWIVILTPVCGWLIYLIAIRHEEVYLEEKFGETYLAYKNTVRRWI